MNELITPMSMTIKDVAEALKKDESTIRKIGKRLYPDKFRNGITTWLNEEHVTAIKLSLGRNSELPKTVLEKHLLIKQAMQFQNEMIIELSSEVQSLQIQLDQEKSWYSVKRVKSLGLLPDLRVIDIWRPLKKWCIENDRQIRGIFDANYGEVKTYPAEAWKAVYGLDLAYREVL